MGISSHPVLIHLAQQSGFQVREHGIQSLHAAGGGVPDIGVADQVDDLPLLVAVQLPDELVLDDLLRALDALVGGTGGGGTVQDEDVLGIQIDDGLPGGVLTVGGLFGIADSLAQVVPPSSAARMFSWLLVSMMDMALLLYMASRIS